MRLLHTSDVKLHTYYDDDIPPYAILSHTWGKVDEEVSLQELYDPSVRTRPGYHKIKQCCALAASQGLDYVWIDTCCIDKTSSAELSEAINSMYAWYLNSKICYAYLVDVRMPEGTNIADDPQTLKGRWFSRGWTLQELLAPTNLVFYDCKWTLIGSKDLLFTELSDLTGISIKHLHAPEEACIAVKLSWASRRKTTRIEDMAYCLLGLLDVNIPLIYGEGPRAFTRLQQEIVRNTSDESIFAWTDPEIKVGGMFARSPTAFAESGNIIQVRFENLDRPPYTMTNRGLAIQIPWSGHNSEHHSNWVHCRQRADLQCAHSENNSGLIQLELLRTAKNNWARTGEWISPSEWKVVPHTLPQKVIYVESIPKSPTFPPKPEIVVSIRRAYQWERYFTSIITDHLIVRNSIVPNGRLTVEKDNICIFCHEPWLTCALEIQWRNKKVFVLLIRAHDSDAEIYIPLEEPSREGELEQLVARGLQSPPCCFTGKFQNLPGIGRIRPGPTHFFHLAQRRVRSTKDDGYMLFELWPTNFNAGKLPPIKHTD